MSRNELENAQLQCPYCWEEIELEVDLSAGSQQYVEDCSVCCQPMLIRLSVDEGSGAFTIAAEAENG